MDLITQLIVSALAFFSAIVPSLGRTMEFVKTAIHTPPHVSVLFGGDMMFDRSIRAVAREKGDDFLLECLDPVFVGHDLVVANLEGPITSNPSMSEGSVISTPENFTFTFPTSTAALLKRHNITLVNLGNNHIMNFSRSGLIETKKWLDAAGVKYFGDPDLSEPMQTVRIDIKGIPFSFVVWSDWTSDNTDITTQQVRAEAEAGRIVVVYTHWGEEYVPATEYMRRLAHDFVDAGAEIIIGSHPHVVQEHEVYQGKHIYYSLGNLIFDQYWNEAVSHGLLVAVTFDARGVKGVTEIPVELKRDRQTCPVR